MVVTRAGLIQRGGSGGFDPAQQTGVDTGSQDVVDGLRRDRAEYSSDLLGDLVGC